jgi:hypothetical protein
LLLITCIEVVDGIFSHWEIAGWLRVVLATVPLLPFVVLARHGLRLLSGPDELARHIAGQAFTFAFFASLGIFICTDLLRDGGVLPVFAWKARSLFYVMSGTWGVGHAWFAWRYR